MSRFDPPERFTVDVGDDPGPEPVHSHLERAWAEIDADARLAWRQQRSDELADARADTEERR